MAAQLATESSLLVFLFRDDQQKHLQKHYIYKSFFAAHVTGGQVGEDGAAARRGAAPSGRGGGRDEERPPRRARRPPLTLCLTKMQG